MASLEPSSPAPAPSFCPSCGRTVPPLRGGAASCVCGARVWPAGVATARQLLEQVEKPRGRRVVTPSDSR